VEGEDRIRNLVTSPKAPANLSTTENSQPRHGFKHPSLVKQPNFALTAKQPNLPPTTSKQPKIATTARQPKLLYQPEVGQAIFASSAKQPSSRSSDLEQPEPSLEGGRPNIAPTKESPPPFKIKRPHPGSRRPYEPSKRPSRRPVRVMEAPVAQMRLPDPEGVAFRPLLSKTGKLMAFRLPAGVDPRSLNPSLSRALHETKQG
jgi:hypothetical protein